MVTDKMRVIEEEQEHDVKVFCDNFYSKYGTNPKVLYLSRSNRLIPLSLQDVEKIVNFAMYKKFGDVYTVRQKVRDRELICYRQAMFYYLHGMGYTLVSISKYFGFNHATIIHSISKIKSFIDIKEERTLTILKELEDGFKETNEPINIVQSDNRGESDSKPVLSTL
jgi:hypothetical protein